MLVNVYSNGSKKSILENFKPISFEYITDNQTRMKVINASHGEREIFKNVKTNEWELRIKKTRKSPQK